MVMIQPVRAGVPAPVRRITVQVLNTAGSVVLATWMDQAASAPIAIRKAVGSFDQVTVALPRRYGWMGSPDDLDAPALDANAELQLDNQLRVYVSSPWTLGNMQSDWGRGVGTGSVPAAADLGRQIWAGYIRAISRTPRGASVTATATAQGAAVTNPVAHIIPFAALLDYDLAVSDDANQVVGYHDPSTPGTVLYSGWAVVDPTQYDTEGIQLGDTVRLLTPRVLNPDQTESSANRYLAYEDAALSVQSIDWSLGAVKFTFGRPTPHIVRDQILKAAPMAINAGRTLISSAAAVEAAGLRATAAPVGTAGNTTFTNAHNAGVARSTGVGAIKFIDGTARDCAGFIDIRIGTTTYYIPVFVQH